MAMDKRHPELVRPALLRTSPHTGVEEGSEPCRTHSVLCSTSATCAEDPDAGDPGSTVSGREEARAARESLSGLSTAGVWRPYEALPASQHPSAPGKGRPWREGLARGGPATGGGSAIPSEPDVAQLLPGAASAWRARALPSVRSCRERGLSADRPALRIASPTARDPTRRRGGRPRHRQA
eukprot:scaffold1034_cov418-Prasinococcus_capsulatus_cf.AAC.38